MGEVAASGIVTGRKVGKNKDADHSVLLLQAELTAGDDIQTIELMNQAGEECNPPNGSKISILNIGRAFRVAVASNDKIAPVTTPGEKRVYSTGADGAEVVAQIHLHDDGTIEVKNAGATVTVTPAGAVQVVADGNTEITSAQTIINNNVVVNGNISATGSISTPSGSMTAAGVLTVTEARINGLNHSSHRHNESGSITGGPV